MNTILNNTLFLALLLASNASTINASGLRASNNNNQRRKTQEDLAPSSESPPPKVVPTVTEASFDDFQQDDDLLQKDDEDGYDDDDDDGWELEYNDEENDDDEQWWDSTEDEGTGTIHDRELQQFSRSEINTLDIGKNMAPIVNEIFERGFKGAGPYQFGFGLRRAYQFGALPIPKACGTPDGSITGTLNLWLPEISGWETITPIGDWEAGTPRIKRVTSDGTQHEWKVNYVVRIHFEEFYGKFNARFDVHSDNCNNKFRLTQDKTIDDIKVTEENPILEVVLFAKGTHVIDPRTNKALVMTEKARINSVQISYSTRDVTSAQLDQYTPWIHDYPFGYTKAKWLSEEIQKYIIPSFHKNMNDHLKNQLPITFGMEHKN